MTNPEVKAQILASRDEMAIAPNAIARAIAFAIDQPADVDVNEIVVRPTAQAGRRDLCRETTVTNPMFNALRENPAVLLWCSR
jgi:hypothetical protein